VMIVVTKVKDDLGSELSTLNEGET
jgi:hypothetical protein